jgi:serine/threonine protein kinase
MYRQGEDPPTIEHESMLSPESHRTRETARPIEPDSKIESAGERVDSALTVTVLKSSGSSARRDGTVPVAITAPVPLPAPGEMIGTFRLAEAIGVGGMGAVFRALDTQLDRQVALKLLPPDQAVDDEVVQRFYQEGRSAAQLDHENIARVFSIGQDGLFHHIAFEYIEGVTLRQKVEADGPQSAREAVDVALQIANALVHASRRGVIHRDIKPSNIILTPQGRAKLVDMGLARRFERGGDHGLTQSGMTLGTFDYISPEQARDPRDVDVRSDLYSLGCTLFHTLTGRPPFPGGTVLQKLLQHQEEPPADVRTLNPEVPAELAAIIAKLMAKERDHRYQGPEHLVRDLLPVAGALGLARMWPDMEALMVPVHHHWWERHLAWLLPAVGFIVVISGLAWWGREFSKPPAVPRKPEPDAIARSTSQLNLTDPSEPPGRSSPSESAGTEGGSSVAPALPRTIPVGSTEDLLSVLAGAPRGSIIVLADDGPYRLGGIGWSTRAPALSADADLTIKAEAGVRPVLRLAEDAVGGDGGTVSLLHFVGGRILIEGVAFELDAPASGELASAIRCEDTELDLRGCSFRRGDPASRVVRSQAALFVRASRPRARGAERPPAVFADSCHFDGGQVAVRAQGPADVTLKDCTLGPARPSIWFDETRSERPIPGELRLSHTSILAGDGPVFRFNGGRVRVRVDDCVIAPAARASASLVQIDDPGNLDWRGRSNIYGPISPYLRTSGNAPKPTDVADFAGWERTSAGPREVGSQVSEAPVWEPADPLQTLAEERDNPTRVFLLDPRLAATSDAGAQRGPFGSILKNVRLAQRLPASRPVPSSMSRVDGLTKAETEATNKADRPAFPQQDRERATGADSPAPSVDVPPPMGTPDPTSLPTMPPMATAGATQPEMEPEEEPDTPAAPMPRPTREETPKDVAPAPPPRPAEPAPADEDVIRGAEQFRTMLRHLGDRDGTLRIGAGVDIELPTVEVGTRAGHQVQIVAEPGPARPRLRFRPAPRPGASPSEWSSLLSLRSGSLRLQGIDLVVPETETSPAERLAAIAVVPGTELILVDCTVTLAVRRSTATAVVVHPPPVVSGRRSGVGDVGPAAVIDVLQGLIRSGGDAVTVAGGCRLELKLHDAMVATEGSLLHALGIARGATREPAQAPSLVLRMDRVAARVKGGLVYLQTTPGEPEMASVDIHAAHTIVSTVTGDHPLFRLEGQDQLEPLRDKIRWEGHNVAYHRIKTYRRDEIVQAGGLPRIYDRDDWTRAFRPTDDSPMLADLRFQRHVDATTPAWKLVRDDLRLAADSTARSVGPDADKVPDPPGDEGL